MQYDDVRVNRIPIGNIYIDILYIVYSMSATTMRLSKRTLRELENLKEKLGAETLEAVIQHLLQERRRRVIRSVFGKDAGKISPFTEVDRGEGRR